MKNTFLIFTLLLGLQSAIGQIRLTQIHLSSGSYHTFADEPTEFSAFGTLAPGSLILSQDFSQFESGYSMMNNMALMRMMRFSNNTTFQSLQVGLKLPSCSGTLRLGISNYRNSLMNSYGYFNESHVVDTLISSQNGSMTFIDSTISKSYFGNYSNQQLRLEAAYVWEVNAGKRWAFSAGAGMSLGMSYQSKTDLRYSEYSDSYAGFGTYQGNETGSSIHETYKNKMAWGANIYVPLGINFRLGTKRAFWKPLMLYTELRPQLSLNSIPSNGLSFSPGIGSASGLRYNIPGEKKKRSPQPHADF